MMSSIRCPQCKAPVTADEAESGACPWCAAELAPTPAAPAAPTPAAPSSRAGLPLGAAVVASLLLGAVSGYLVGTLSAQEETPAAPDRIPELEALNERRDKDIASLRKQLTGALAQATEARQQADEAKEREGEALRQAEEAEAAAAKNAAQAKRLKEEALRAAEETSKTIAMKLAAEAKKREEESLRQAEQAAKTIALKLVAEAKKREDDALRKAEQAARTMADLNRKLTDQTRQLTETRAREEAARRQTEQVRQQGERALEKLRQEGQEALRKLREANERTVESLRQQLRKATAPVRTEDKEAFLELFNGRDLSGFKTFRDDDPDKLFLVREGVIVCTGKKTGYLYTDKSYKNYVLTYDWKYARPKDFADDAAFGGNSGCLLHITGEHKIWPRSIEVQGSHREHGRLQMHSGTRGKEEYFKTDELTRVRRPVGDWNTTEITCRDGTVTVHVNGVAISKGSSDLTAGRIGWQSEGGEIHFKKILIKELK